ncbi:hypothetical protein BCR44DRAFT_30864 [Catenaria anguillulae PL171]|uniref:Uncharacterized protein n=1 Tax=Catenaria anguillulae PL171 TaxID=765915 RepID=A0A1Y2HG15_9FUNG|nr:hypothetical protein BCR44DRAFT_30864 [Catenaria anguillulae PL171]
MSQSFRLLLSLAVAALLLAVHGAPQQPSQIPARTAKCQEFLDSIGKDPKCFGPVTAVLDEFGKLDMETGAKALPTYYRRFLDAYCKRECNKPHEDLVNAAIANCEEIANAWRFIDFTSSAGKDAQQARVDWGRSYQLAVRDMMCMRDPTDPSKMCSPDLLDTGRKYQVFNNSVFPPPSEPIAVMYGRDANYMFQAWKESLMQPKPENLTVVPPEAFCTPCRAAGLTQAYLHWMQEFTPYTNSSGSQGWPTVAEQKKVWEEQSSKMNKYCELHNIKNPTKVAVFRTDAKVTVGLPANESSVTESPSKGVPAGGDSGNKKPDGSSGAAMVRVGAVAMSVTLISCFALL